MLSQNSAIDSWIFQVGISHSDSIGTEKRYKLNLERFCSSVKKTAEEIILDYDTLPEKTFKRAYAQAIIAHLGELKKNNCSSGSVSNALNSIRSFFKYNSLPLNFIPTVRVNVENHNRDIESNEITDVLREAEPRERTVYSLIAQAGLRPDTVTKLRIKDVEGIIEKETPIPCLIRVPKDETKGKYQEYFTFAPMESIAYLKEYLKSRKQPLTQDSFLIARYEDENSPVRPGVFSHLFRRTVLKLKERNVLTFKTNRKQIRVENKNHKVIRNYVARNEIRLYTLRKFFRKYAGQAGQDYVNFWMGHTTALGVDLAYFSRDVEFHRQIFREKAMPNLRLESHTPTEAEKEIEQLKDQLQTQNAEIKELKQILQPWTEILKAVSKNGSVEIVRQNDNQPLGQIQYGTEKELDERMRALEDQFKKLNERHSK